MKMTLVLAKLRSVFLIGALGFAASFWTGCCTLTPTGKPIKITVQLQHPVGKMPVKFGTTIGTLTGIELKTAPGAHNGRLYFNWTTEATVDQPTFTLQPGEQEKTLYLTIEKGKLSGKTVILTIYDVSADGLGENYFGAHAYSLDGTEQEGVFHEMGGTHKSGSTIKIH